MQTLAHTSVVLGGWAWMKRFVAEELSQVLDLAGSFMNSGAFENESSLEKLNIGKSWDLWLSLINYVCILYLRWVKNFKNIADSNVKNYYEMKYFFAGAFLVTYAIAMLFCGIPIFFQEVAVGQYLGAGGMTLVGELVPILQGVGYATMTIVFFLDIYYCIIIAWTLFYLISSFTKLPGLPWENCGKCILVPGHHFLVWNLRLFYLVVIEIRNW